MSKEMFYTPQALRKVIDPAAGSSEYLMHVSTGSGKSADMMDMIDNPPFSDCMTDPWAHDENIKLKNTLIRVHNELLRWRNKSIDNAVSMIRHAVGAHDE